MAKEVLPKLGPDGTQPLISPNARWLISMTRYLTKYIGSYESLWHKANEA